jgi:hypothetical protein
VRAAACQCSTGSKAIEERKKKPSATYLIGLLSLFDIQGQKKKDWDTQTFQTTTQKEKKKENVTKWCKPHSSFHCPTIPQTRTAVYKKEQPRENANQLMIGNTKKQKTKKFGRQNLNNSNRFWRGKKKRKLKWFDGSDDHPPPPQSRSLVVKNKK